MKILQYYPIALGGDFGTAISVRGWCSSLAGAGADVTLAVDADVRMVSPPPGVRCISLPHVGRGGLRVPRGISAIIDQHDVLVAHGGWILHPIAAGRRATRLGVPYVSTPHGAYHPLVLKRRAALKRAWKVALEQRSLRRAFATHIFFQDERRHLAALDALGSTIVAPNGVSTPDKVCWDGGSGGYLAWLGRFDPINKGLDLALEGLARLPASDRPVLQLRGPDVRAGRVAVTRLATRLGLKRWVVLGGPLYGEDKWRFLSQAAGFIFPSRFEAFSLAVGEAVALGVPSLVASFPLGRFLVERGGAISCGLSPESVASGLTTLLSGTAAAIGRQGAEVVRTELHWDIVARSWLKQMDGLLGRPNRSGSGLERPPP